MDWGIIALVLVVLVLFFGAFLELARVMTGLVVRRFIKGF